jgi:hypothetical protein
MDAARRSLLQAISMLAASSALAAESPTLASFIKPYSELPVKQNGQNESRSILNGVTHSAITLRFTRRHLLQEVRRIHPIATSMKSFY